MYMPHPRGKPNRDEVGCFMFFAWPVLLIVGLIQLFFWVVGWLFEQPWFYVFVVIGLIALAVNSCIVR